MTAIEKWIEVWPEHLRTNPDEYEVVVAHPLDYLSIRDAGPFPDSLSFDWSERVMQGHPLVLEHAANYYSRIAAERPRFKNFPDRVG